VAGHDGPSSHATIPVQHFAPPPYPPSMSGTPVSFPTPGHSAPCQGQGQAHGSFLAPSYPPPEKEYGSSSVSGYPANQQFVPYGQGQLKESPSVASSDVKGEGPGPQQFKPPPGPPPAYTPSPQVSQPPSGNRIPLNTTSNFFPNSSELGPPPCFDADGSPVYLGSALFPRSVHPCKIGMHLEGHALVAYGGGEQSHKGRYDLLPFVPQSMEFVRTSRGLIPQGRRPVEGGYEENGAKLYHAVAMVNGVRVPGKTGLHL
jgi:hypothetical protein